jgi:hypothetical protein
MARPGKKKGLDKTVVFGALAILLLIGAALLFRFLMKDSCPGVVDFTITGEKVAGSELTFTDLSGAQAESWQWDFGDASPATTGSEAKHIFELAGKYVVILTVNGECAGEKEIEILAPVAMEEEEEETIQLAVKGPKEAFVGTPVQFFDETPGAVSWEWEFSETGEIDSREKNPKYIFTERGPHEVFLSVNGQRGNPPVMIVNVKKKKDDSAPAPKPEPKPKPGPTPTPEPKPKPTPPAPPKKALTETEFFALVKRECAKDMPDFTGALKGYMGGDLNMTTVVEPGKNPVKLQNWLNVVMGRDCNIAFTKATFKKDENGDINEIILSK